MKIVVMGGSGLIGSKLVAKLRERRHETLAASPASGVNTLTGQGLPAALDALAQLHLPEYRAKVADPGQ